MFRFLRRFLPVRRQEKAVEVTVAPAQGPSIVPNAEEIFRYMMDLEKDGTDVFRSEIDDRGLAFGDLVPERPLGGQVRFRIHDKRSLIIGDRYLIDLLNAILSKKGLIGYTLVTDPSWNSIRVEDPDIRSKGEGGVWSSVNRQFKVFLEVRNSYGLEVKAYGPKGMSVIMSLAETLGYTTTPSMYRFESDVPLSEIVSHALVWHDKEHDKYYSELKYDGSKKLQLVYLGGGPNKKFPDGNFITEVSGGTHKAGFRLNNLNVELTTVEKPTKTMLEARLLIREDERKRGLCAVKGCGEPAAYDIYSTHMEMGSIGSMSSMGSIMKSCADSEHVRLVKRMDPSPKQTVSAARPAEVW